MSTMSVAQYRDLVERLTIISDELDAKGVLYAPTADAVRDVLESLKLNFTLDDEEVAQ